MLNKFGYFYQGFVEEEQDFVLSPLGYSVTLAIMAEGARGETRNQLVSALHLPEDTYAVRQNYKTVLQSMTVSSITVTNSLGQILTNSCQLGC